MIDWLYMRVWYVGAFLGFMTKAWKMGFSKGHNLFKWKND